MSLVAKGCVLEGADSNVAQVAWGVAGWLCACLRMFAGCSLAFRLFFFFFAAWLFSMLVAEVVFPCPPCCKYKVIFLAFLVAFDVLVLLLVLLMLLRFLSSRGGCASCFCWLQFVALEFVALCVVEIFLLPQKKKHIARRKINRQNFLRSV